MEKILKCNGIDLCYDDTEDAGKKILILIHGLTGNKETMYVFREMFRDRFRCICVDTRGHGASSHPEHYDLNDHAEDMKALIESFGVEKVDVLGYSMGSYIAAATASKYPDIIDNLVLLCTKPSGKTSSIERIAATMGIDMATMTPEQLQQIVMANAFAPSTLVKLKNGELPEVAAQLMEAPGIQLTPEEKAAESRSLADFDLTPRLGNIKCKTLVVAGEYDNINPKELGREVADLIPGSRYVVVEEAGHMVPFEQPAAFVKLVDEFILG